MGSAAEGSNGNRLQLCGSQERQARGIMEILATRLDTGATDYCRFFFSLPPRFDPSSAELGRLADELSPGQASAAVIPGNASTRALLPGLAIGIGGSRLVVKRYDSTTRTLAFHTAAMARVPSGTAISAEGELKIVDAFAGSAIFEPPIVNGPTIELRTTLYADGSPTAIPIAVTFWSTDTLYFDGSPSRAA